MNILSVLAGIITIISVIPYIVAVARRQTQPVKATWLIWAILDTITFGSMYMKGTLNFQMWGVIVGVWVITAFAFRNGKPGWTRIELGCLICALVAVILWYTSGDPVIAMTISLSAMLVASIPTFISAWQDPTRENKLSWWMGLAASACSIIAMPHWTLADAMQPCVFIFINGVVVTILFLRRPPPVVVPIPADAAL